MKKTMPLKEYYAILGVPVNSSLDDVKRAYRKRAFELHPDLNPSAGASQQFQQLNEAYVNLIRLLDTKGTPPPTNNRAATDANDVKAGHQAYAEQARKEQQEKERLRREKQEEERRQRREAENKLREKEEREAKEKREQDRRERLRSEIERQEAERLVRKEKARFEKERLAQAREAATKERQEKVANQEPKAEAYKRSYAKAQPGSAEETTEKPTDGRSVGTPGATASTHNSSFTGAYGTNFTGTTKEEPSRETLLNDLLNDPFARRVYEDIYAEVENRKQTTQMESTAPATPSDHIAEVSKSAKDFAKNVGGAMKGWLHSQIDEVQEIAMSAANLYAGARIRLQIKVGISGSTKTVDVTLPPDFAPGKPLRLRGMGKKVGKWQGDLYLIFKYK